MSAELRSPLRAVSIALGVGVAIFVSQTAASMRLGANEDVAIAFRAGFALTDSALLVAIIVLAHRSKAARGTLFFAAAFAFLAAFTDVLGLFAAGDLSHALARAELPFALGLALLLLLGLRAIAPGPRWFTALVLVTVGIAVVHRVVQVSVRTMPVKVEWIAWVIGVARTQFLAAFATILSRVVMKKTPKAPVPSPYRDTAAPSSRPAPMPESARPAIASAEATLGLYRATFIIRFVATIVTLLVLFFGTGRRPSALAMAFPFASLVTEALLAARVFRLLKPAAEIARTRGALVFAIALLLLAVACDASSLLGLALMSSREGMEILAPASAWVTLFSLSSMLAVAWALQRIGERLGAERVIGLVRAQRAIVITGAALLGALPFVTASSLVFAGLGLSILALGIAGFACTLMVISAARTALRVD